MELLAALLVLLVVTRACSEVAVRFGQPALVGELLGGVLLGVVVVTLADGANLVEHLRDSDAFQAVLDLAVFFLMLLAGIEMRPRDLARAGRRALPVAIVGMALPLALGFALGWWWLPASDWRFAQALFIGVALSITAVPVAVKVLMDLGQLQSETGEVVVASAVIDDVLSLVLLAVLTSVVSANEPISALGLGMVALKVAIYFAIAWLVFRYALRWVGWAIDRLDLEHAEFTLLIVIGLALSVLAELLGMHFLIGAFTAGVMFTREVIGKERRDEVQEQVEAVTLGFLAPVFFASIGIHLDPGALWSAPLFLVAILFAATLGKLVGAGLTARLTGFSTRQSLAIGGAMNARGAVEIIIADIALRAGLFDHPDPPPPAVDYLFSAVVIMAILTTLASPLMLRWLLPGANDGQRSET